MNKRARPTGTPFAAALARQPAPAPAKIELTTDVPCPGPRFGKAAEYRALLLDMHGDASFTVKDANLVYIEAKKIGVTITTRQEDKKVRVWRIS